jgi:hypothetical protein
MTDIYNADILKLLFLRDKTYAILNNRNATYTSIFKAEKFCYIIEKRIIELLEIKNSSYDFKLFTKKYR